MESAVLVPFHGGHSTNTQQIRTNFFLAYNTLARFYNRVMVHPATLLFSVMYLWCHKLQLSSVSHLWRHNRRNTPSEYDCMNSITWHNMAILQRCFTSVCRHYHVSPRTFQNRNVMNLYTYTHCMHVTFTLFRCSPSVHVKNPNLSPRGSVRSKFPAPPHLFSFLFHKWPV